MRASPSLSQLWQPHSRLCQLCRVCEQQRSCSPGFCRKELHATEGAVEVRRARRRLEDTVTDERVGVFTPDKDGDTADGAGCVPVIAARRGTVCGEVGRVPRFCSTQHPHPLGSSIDLSHRQPPPPTYSSTSPSQCIRGLTHGPRIRVRTEIHDGVGVAHTGRALDRDRSTIH